MIYRNGKLGRALAVTSLTGLLCAGCASDRARPTHEGNTRATTLDTSGTPYSSGTSAQGSTGMGGSGMSTYGPDTVRTDTMSHANGGYYPGTGGSGTGGMGTGGAGGTGMGGAMGMPDSGHDTSGVYRGGPTGPFPDSGVGGAGGIPPGPDTLWHDTLNPPDTSRLPGEAHQTNPGNW